jgi:outer membrane protein TolC
MSVTARRFLAGMVLILVWAGPTDAQQIAPPSSQAGFTLPELLQLALANNRTLKVAGLQVGKAQNDVDAARTRAWPALDTQIFEGRLSTLDFTFAAGSLGMLPAAGPLPPASTTVTNPAARITFVSLQAAQPLTQLRRITLGVRELALERDIMEERRRARAQTIAMEVRRLYYAILDSESAIAASGVGIRFYQELQRQTAEQVAAQSAFPADLATVDAALAQREHENLVLRNSLATQRQQLGLLIGRDVEVATAIAPLAAPSEAPVDLADAATNALRERPDVREAELKVRQAEAMVRERRAHRLPDVSAVVRFIGVHNLDLLPATITAVGVFGTWEPFDWGRKRQEIAASVNVFNQSTLALQEAQAQARVELERLYRRLVDARALVPVADQARSAADQRLRLARTRRDAQAALASEVLQAETAFAEAERDYQRAVTAWRTAEAEFQRAQGKM